MEIRRQFLPKKISGLSFMVLNNAQSVLLHEIMAWMSRRGTHRRKLFERENFNAERSTLSLLCQISLQSRQPSLPFMLDLMHPNCSNYDFILKQPFFKTVIIATHYHFMSKKRVCKENNSVLPLGKYKRTKYILLNFLSFRMDMHLEMNHFVI